MIAFQLDSLLKLDAFYDLSYNDLNQSFLNHFHQVTVSLSSVHFYWLNQISGKPLPITSGYQKDVVGPDGKFQCSLQGPDVVILPPKPNLNVEIPSEERYPKLSDF